MGGTKQAGKATRHPVLCGSVLCRLDHKRGPSTLRNQHRTSTGRVARGADVGFWVSTKPARESAPTIQNGRNSAILTATVGPASGAVGGTCVGGVEVGYIGRRLIVMTGHIYR
ncbi:hypothetical protein Slala05_27790 [Streptomyces lavendulae subsp. lavendulae]|nr:hypothetical protein Slala05_27790 [Streptomyces lavendulae subsp. lavendulae]